MIYFQFKTGKHFIRVFQLQRQENNLNNFSVEISNEALQETKSTILIYVLISFQINILVQKLKKKKQETM